MATAIDIETVVVTLNDRHTIAGWSQDTDALMLPDSFEALGTKRGADGMMEVTRTGAKGGPVTVKLLVTSPSCTYLFTQAARQMTENLVIKWKMDIEDAVNGWEVHGVEGVLMTHPLGPTIGQGEAASREFVFDFERLTPDFSRADFTRRLVTPT